MWFGKKSTVEAPSDKWRVVENLHKDGNFSYNLECRSAWDGWDCVNIYRNKEEAIRARDLHNGRLIVSKKVLE